MLEAWRCSVEREEGGLHSDETALRVEVHRLCTFVESPHTRDPKKDTSCNLCNAILGGWAERLDWNAADPARVACMNSLPCLNAATKPPVLYDSDSEASPILKVPLDTSSACFGKRTQRQDTPMSTPSSSVDLTKQPIAPPKARQTNSARDMHGV